MGVKNIRRLLGVKGDQEDYLLNTATGYMLGISAGTPSLEGFAPNALLIDTTNGLYYNSGTATTAAWSAIGGASLTLDGAFDNGKIINGANSSGNAVQIGDGSDALLVYANSSVPTIATNGTSNLVIAPDGGGTTVTGTLTASGVTTSTGNLVVGSNKLVVTATTGALSTASSLTSTASTGNAIVINTDKFLVAADTGNVTVAGDLAVTGDITGTFTGTWGATSWSGSSLTATGSTSTGQALKVSGAAVTTGDVLQLYADASLTSGYFLRCVDVSTDKFTITEDGTTTITGTAAGSDALVLTAGDATLTSGHLVLTSGNATLTDGNLTLSDGTVDITVGTSEGDAVDIVPVADGAAIDINLPATYNLSSGAIDIDASTGSGPVIELAFSGAYTGDAVSLNMTNAVGAKAIDITGAGTRTAALVHITDVPANGSPTFNIDATPGHSAGYVFDIDIAGTSSAPILDVAFAAAYTGPAAKIDMTNAVGANAISLTGAGTRTSPLVTITDVPADGAAVFDLNVTPGHANGFVFDIDVAGTSSAPIMDVAFAAAYTGDAVQLNMTNAVGAKALDITGAGTRTASLVHITDVPTTSAPTIDLDLTPGAGVQAGIDIDVAGTQAADILAIDFSAAFTGDAVNVTMTNCGAAAQALVIDGGHAATGHIVDISSSGALAGGTGKVVSIASSGNVAAATAGICLDLAETGAAQATSYVLHISSTNNEALHVDSGISLFDEDVQMGNGARLQIGSTAVRAGTESTNSLNLFNGTAPAGALTNGVTFYSAAGEAQVMDAAGNATLLSPHDEEGKWVFHSKDTTTGRVLHIDMEEFVKAACEKLGLGFVREFIEEPGAMLGPVQ